ncbi:hypothetical protein ACTXT7_005102 [Hymenolepis weldensis]
MHLCVINAGLFTVNCQITRSQRTEDTYLLSRLQNLSTRQPFKFPNGCHDAIQSSPLSDKIPMTSLINPAVPLLYLVRTKVANDSTHKLRNESQSSEDRRDLKCCKEVINSECLPSVGMYFRHPLHTRPPKSQCARSPSLGPMLGDIGRIPIISLSGCKSLSDILSELPLPQPLPKTVSGPELIDDPQVYQEAQNLLQSHSDFLVESLSSALASTTTDGIVLKNDQPNAPIDFHTLPPVLKDAITKMPNILEENRSFKCIYSSKEVLQILNKEVGKSSAKLTSPTKSIPSSNARHQPAITGPTVAPVKLTLKQPQPPGEVSGSGIEGIYSVTAVEPLKLSIKRASILPHMQETSKRSKIKRRSKNSSSTSSASNPLSNPVISGNQNVWPINPAESLKPQSVPGAQVPIPIHTSPSSIVQQSSRHHQLLPTAVVAPVPPGLPNPSPSVQLVIPPPPPTTSSTSRKSGQLLSNVFNQLLHSSEQDSTIASLLSSSDGQSTGTPTSMEPPFHPRSPPLSVPSNCSYPATPGMNSSSLSVNNPNVGSVGPVPDPSPINAIFDTTAGANADLSDGRGDSNPQPAVPPQPPPPPPPRGLAAYLQKSRYHHAEVVASPEEGDAYARQHGSVPPMSSSASSPWTERRSGAHASTASNVGAGIYPTSSSSLTSTPNGQEAGSKEKRGTGLADIWNSLIQFASFDLFKLTGNLNENKIAPSSIFPREQIRKDVVSQTNRDSNLEPAALSLALPFLTI